MYESGQNKRRFCRRSIVNQGEFGCVPAATILTPETRVCDRLVSTSTLFSCGHEAALLGVNPERQLVILRRDPLARKENKGVGVGGIFLIPTSILSSVALRFFLRSRGKSYITFAHISSCMHRVRVQRTRNLTRPLTENKSC